MYSKRDEDIFYYNCNLSDVYAFAKWANMNYHGLGYIKPLASKGSYEIGEVLREKVLEKFSSIICMLERQYWTLISCSEGTISSYREVCDYLNIPIAPEGGEVWNSGLYIQEILKIHE